MDKLIMALAGLCMVLFFIITIKNREYKLDCWISKTEIDSKRHSETNIWGFVFCFMAFIIDWRVGIGGLAFIVTILLLDGFFCVLFNRYLFKVTYKNIIYSQSIANNLR